MKAKTRRKLEMGARALDFSQANPEPSAGYLAAVSRLEQLIARGRDLFQQQLDGFHTVRGTSARKRDLLRTMRRAQLRHLMRVARMAARELPELREKFKMKRGTIPYLVFRSMAHGIVAEALSQKELMVKYGLSDTVLASLAESLAEFDQAIERGMDARLAHVGASAELDLVGDEIVQIVQVIDALNRFRFADRPDLLAGWRSASNVITLTRSPVIDPAPAPPAGGIQPAA